MMEFALGLIGLALTVLGIILGYIWRANSRLTVMLLEGQKALMEGQERLQMGVERIASIDKDIHEGQKEMTILLLKFEKKPVVSLSKSKKLLPFKS